MAAQPILVGDEIALNGERYPVVIADSWQFPGKAFAKMLTQSLQVLRAPELQNGKRGDAALHLSALKCTPLLPLGVLSNTVELTAGMQAPHLLRQVFVEVNGSMMHLLVEDLKIGS